ncbi:MAG: 30S ribosomal protein S12 methylthiotransferase RimO [Acidimicrobiia bacterium]|nr:MAG: 30S ribosomal protein S12 methylthiotransferase RimO [Acidimicrobiia bacterium]
MPTDAPRVWLATLGCAKNQVDSEKLRGRLATAGYAEASAPESADVVMVNTCAFIEEARRESVATVLEAADRRSQGAPLLVLGCMAQRYGAELAAALPEATAVIGMDGYGDLVGDLDALTGHQSAPTPVGDILYDALRPTPDVPYAFVKAAEGCDKRCTFCAIPGFRGRQRSRPVTDVVSEVTALCADGVREVVLVAQDLAAYGRDLDDASDLPRLIREATRAPGLERLRLLYLYPREVTDALIAAVAGNPLVAAYFDLSLQHASGRLLRAMSRPGDGGSHLELIDRIRAAAPDAALRSSFITGFPGETEADFEELMGFLEAADLDWAGFFPFSAEEGTPAATLPGQVPSVEAAERARLLASRQEEITGRHGAEQMGRTLVVLVDGVEDGVPVGRSHREAPEIDGVVRLDAGSRGQMVTARVTASYGDELLAEVLSR